MTKFIETTILYVMLLILTFAFAFGATVASKVRLLDYSVEESVQATKYEVIQMTDRFKGKVCQ